ncbi:MAG: ABC-F family ATP-binding cassette domain-containing protein [Dehalococcoidales bacterium]|nr:ABC-F family ATP-binding cassette domain-containing protein [Dehalococcoidales bacterium]
MLSISNLSKSFGEQLLFTGLSLDINARDRIGLIGANGSGKTTLFSIITGGIPPDTGNIGLRKGVTVGYLSQNVEASRERRLLENVASASTMISGLAHRIEVIREAISEGADGEEMAALLDELGDLQHRFEAANGYNIENEAKVILARLGFKMTDLDRPLVEFSGGWLMRAELARLLVLNPDILLLDEPTNHLDLESIIWFERYLKSYQGAVMVTSHDREFLNHVVKKILVIEPDDVILHPGNYDSYMTARAKEKEALESAARRQESRVRKQMHFIERFRYQATKATQVQSRLKMLAKTEAKVKVPRATRQIHFSFPAPHQSGQEVISLSHVQKSYDGRVVYGDLNLTLERGDKVALVGPNGAGKTTLLRILAGILPFDGGERKPGHNVSTAYYAQYVLETLNPESTVLGEVRQAAPGDSDERLRGLLGAFLFSGDSVMKSVSILSGGEKSRLAIARMLIRPANFLLMDEPTNHLDINSREVLSDALEAYQGTLCFITHDRTLIRQVANKIIGIDNGRIEVYRGNYDSYLEWKESMAARDPGADAAGNISPAAGKPSERQRKTIEAALRNRFYRESQPLRLRIASIESELSVQEARLSQLESQFADAESYQDGASVVENINEHRILKDRVKLLTAEWEKISTQLEDLNRAHEAEMGRRD